jgi:hypothetical protein
VGANIVFSVMVLNSGPDSATSVQVTDLLPSDYSYVSDDGMGAYNSGTGVWMVGTLANAASETLNITATVLSGSNTLNNAEVTASDAFDPNSIPDDNILDEDDQDDIDPLPINPLLNGAIDVVVNGPTRASSSKKSFVVVITNTRQLSFFADPAIFEALVGATEISDCTGHSKSLSPGRSTRFRCTYNPAAFGLSPGGDVTYSAMLNLANDADPSDNTDTEIRTVE